MPYLNVEEIETKLEIAAATYPQLCELITLPNGTHEGRISHALRIGSGSLGNPSGLLFIGGVHAREWGSSDILIFFLEALLEAYEDSTGLTFGNKSYSWRTVRALVDCLDIFIFPDVNPDGKFYSQNTVSMWRKNRGPTSNAECLGTDLNRNFDFLWDFEALMHSNAALVVSDDPCDPQVYHGTAAFSEPETQNVKWLLNQYPHIQYFVDIHCYSELILYPWGDDNNQGDDSNMNFQTPAYDGLRGIRDDLAYREYISNYNQDRHRQLATWMNSALHAVRGKSYTVQPAFGLYGTTGSSQDYTFSRHKVDPTIKKIYSFTIEWGDWYGGFQPDYDSEMTLIMRDVAATLTELCFRVYNLDCHAPIFPPGNWLECLLLYFAFPVLLVIFPFLVFFLGLKKTRCLYRRARFRVSNCSKGNEEPCIKV